MMLSSLPSSISGGRTHGIGFSWCSYGQVDDPTALQARDLAALVHHQFTDADQVCTGDVARQAEKVGRVHLVVVAEAVGRAQQAVLDLLVQVTTLFLEQALEGTLQQL